MYWRYMVGRRDRMVFEGGCMVFFFDDLCDGWVVFVYFFDGRFMFVNVFSFILNCGCNRTHGRKCLKIFMFCCNIALM